MNLLKEHLKMNKHLKKRSNETSQQKVAVILNKYRANT